MGCSNKLNVFAGVAFGCIAGVALSCIDLHLVAKVAYSCRSSIELCDLRSVAGVGLTELSLVVLNFF